MPKVTVVCPTYNRGRAIEATIRSVCAQTMTDWELIVASDGSDDDTDEVVAALAEQEPRVRLLRTRRFGYPSGPCNLAQQQARSEILAYIPHDDEWEPHHLAVLTAALDQGADLAYTRARKVDRTGRVLETTPALVQYWHPQIQLMNAVCEPVRAAYRAELVARVGSWRESPAGLEDWDLWLRMVDAGARFTPLDEVTARILSDRSTRQHTMAYPHGIEIARFPDGRAARAAYRALTDLRLADRYRAAYRSDLRRWYGRLWDSGELAMPAAWRGDRARLWAAIDESADADDDLRGLLRIDRDGDDHVLVNTVATQTAAHADRMAGLYREVMSDSCAVIDDVLSARRVTVE